MEGAIGQDVQGPGTGDTRAERRSRVSGAPSTSVMSDAAEAYGKCMELVWV